VRKLAPVGGRPAPALGHPTLRGTATQRDGWHELCVLGPTSQPISSPLLEFLNPVRRSHAGPLVNVTAAYHFWHLLPRDDPFAAQGAVSEALSDMVARNHPNLGQLRALLALDQLARDLGDALLIDYVPGDAQALPLETSSWQSAFALARSFGQAFEHALGHIRDDGPPRGWREYITTVLLRLFQHRQIEFLLRPFISEHSIADSWSELHRAYRYAEASGIASEPLVSRRCHEERGEQSTLEREYIHILLLELLNDGHLSPYEAFWVNRRIPCWHAVLSLQAESAAAVTECAEHRFVVDLDSAEGLVRPSRLRAGVCRHLDPAPMLALIRDEIAALRDPSRPAPSLSAFRRSRQLKLLRRINGICLPKSAPIDRRGARLPAVSTVEAVVGFPNITRILRHESHKNAEVAPSALPELEVVTNTAGDKIAASSSGACPDGGQASVGMAGDFDVPEQVWQLKDRSDSGCRLRGRIGSSSHVLPGALVAFRECRDVPWTLAVVRRLRKRIGDRVDIGVEYIGHSPLAVNLSAESDPKAQEKVAPDKKLKHCIALYLQESSEHPKMPFKTLILSPHKFKAGYCVSLRSNGAKYTVRLKEPIEEQDGFVWLPYEVVGFRRAADGQAKGQPTSGDPALGPRPKYPPLAAFSQPSAESTVQRAVRRIRGAGET